MILVSHTRGAGSRCRSLRAALVAFAFATVAPSVPAADAYPTRPVRVVVGTPAGSGIDITLRAMQDLLHAELGQPIVIEQRVGADQLLAARQVAAAPADGYTLLAGTRTQIAVNPVAYANPGYDPDRDLAPITLLGHNVMLLAVQPSVPVRTLAELAPYSRAHPHTLNYGAGAGSVLLATEALKAAIGADLMSVPYNGFGPSLNALVAGDVHVSLLDVPTALPSIRAGRIRALVVSGERRFPELLGVPTFAEAGYANAEPPVWNALYAPAGTPDAVIARLRAAFVRALETPGIAARMMSVGIVPATSTPDELRAKAQRERTEVAALMKRLGMAPR